MTALTFFTAKLNYQVVEADTASDLDYDPQVKGVMAGVTITAFVVQPLPAGDDVHANEIPADNLSPTAAMVVLAPIDCRLDNGRLMLFNTADGSKTNVLPSEGGVKAFAVRPAAVPAA